MHLWLSWHLLSSARNRRVCVSSGNTSQKRSAAMLLRRTAEKTDFSLGCMSARPALTRSTLVLPSAAATAIMRPLSCSRTAVSAAFDTWARGTVPRCRTSACQTPTKHVVPSRLTSCRHDSWVSPAEHESSLRSPFIPPVVDKHRLPAV